ncbi:Phospholipid-transporting ATPase [Balamuthia mandrillaris]
MLHQLFLEQASRLPQQPAVISYENVTLDRVLEAQENPSSLVHELPLRSCSYAELERRSAVLAGRLRSSWANLVEESIGSSSQPLVAVQLQPSLDLIVAILAVMRAGAVYVPLEPSLPWRRKKEMLRMLPITLLLTEPTIWRKERQHWLLSSTSSHGRPTLEEEEEEEEEKEEEKEEEETNPSLQFIQEVVFIGHYDADDDHVQPREKAQKEAVPTSDCGQSSNNNSEDVLNQQQRQTLGFNNPKTNDNMLAYVMFTSGTTGSPCPVRVFHTCVVEPNIKALGTLWKVSTEDTVFMASPITFDPSIVEIFMALAYGACLLVVPQQIKLAPQALTRMQQRDSASDVRPRLFNLYGTTECSVWATVAELSNWGKKEAFVKQERIPLGKPFPGTQLELRSLCNGHILQQWEPGTVAEICIGGPTRVCLVNNEDHGQRLRDTGDLVRVLGDLQLVYVGRSDNQVKILGQRLQLEEIEHVISHIPCVQGCKVLSLKTGGYNPSLLAFIAADVYYPEQTEDILLSVRQQCNQRLPGTLPSEHSKLPYCVLLKQGATSIDIAKLLTGLGDALHSAGVGVREDTAFRNEALNILLHKPIIDALPLLMDTLSSLKRSSPTSTKELNQPPTRFRFANTEARGKEMSSFIPTWAISKRNSFSKFGENPITWNPFEHTKVPGYFGLRWKVFLEKCIDSSPLIVGQKDSGDPRIFIGSHSGLFVALSVSTGNIIWKQRLGGRIESTAAVVRKAPRVLMVTLVLFGVVVMITIFIVWIARHELVIGSLIAQAQSFHHRQYLGDVYTTLHLLHYNNTSRTNNAGSNSYAVAWERSFVAPIFSSPVVDARQEVVAFGCCDGKLYALNCRTGEMIWSFTTCAPVFSSPSLWHGTLWFGAHDHKLYCCELSSGSLLAEIETPDAVNATPCLVSVPCADVDLLVSCSVNGSLLLMSVPRKSSAEPSSPNHPRDTQEGVTCSPHVLSQVLLPGKLFASPVILSGSMFVPCRDDYLYCFGLVFDLGYLCNCAFLPRSRTSRGRTLSPLLLVLVLLAAKVFSCSGMKEQSQHQAPSQSAATRWLTRFRTVALRKKSERTGWKQRKIQFNRDAQRFGFLWTARQRLGQRVLAAFPLWKRSYETGPVRTIHCNLENKLFRTNSISTTKYTPLTFIPKNLAEQFGRFANIWFLVIAILQRAGLCLLILLALFPSKFIPQITPLNPAASVVPLVLVLLVTGIKEAYEDMKRRQSDRSVNNRQVEVLVDGRLQLVPWRKVRVGQVLRIKCDEDIPADVILLNSSNADGLAYLETANLDGETNLKVRQALPDTVGFSVEDVTNNPLVIQCEHPNPELYNFEGTIKLPTQATDLPLNLEQTLWRGCVLRNTKWVLAVVVYAGMDSKIMKNARPPPYKRSSLEKDMNRTILTVFAFILSVDLLGGIFAAVWFAAEGRNQTYLRLEDMDENAGVVGVLAFFSYVILLHSMVPISLYMYLELIKVITASHINSDLDMYHSETDTPAKANTSNLAEELGQIEFIFSDKTGTLTSNEMFFKCCSINGKSYGIAPQDSEIGQSSDTERNMEGMEPSDEAYIFRDPKLFEDIDNDSSDMIRMFFKLLALCHSVIIANSSDDDVCEDAGHFRAEDDEVARRTIVYQASSPDEAALVAGAQRFGFEFIARTPAQLCLRVDETEEEWELLNILEFNSDRKRMSVLVRRPEDGQIILLCKGADSVIYNRLAKKQKLEDIEDKTYQHLKQFANLGLRTLCMAFREIPEEEYESWAEQYAVAALQIKGRDDAIDAVAEQIETDLQLLGATAVEDRLQEGVPEAIDTLLRAGIKMWVLTGDKMETAINIGFSCSLLEEDMQLLIFSSEPTENGRVPIRNHRDAMAQLRAYANSYFSDIDCSNWQDEYAAAPGESSSSVQCADTANEDLHSFYREDDSDVEMISSSTSIRTSTKNKTGNAERQQSYAVIIDGDSLGHFVPHDGTFNASSAQFLQLAMRCKVLICCRVSPLQKSLVVSLVKQGIRATTLAIGDGANDVPMIQSSHVGVGISGKEGRQAVLAADYAIAQFRFLVPLLLVHGHWSYRRMAVLLLYSFYKNVVFGLSNFWFGVLNGFSSQTLYESWAVSMYNVLFTGLPILAVAIFDRPHILHERRRSCQCIRSLTLPDGARDVVGDGRAIKSLIELLAYPQLYQRGLRKQEFSTIKYWKWQLLGVYQSVVAFFFGMGAFSNGNVSSSGRVLDLFGMGHTIMLTVILIVTARVSLLTSTWTLYNHGAITFSLLLWFLFIIAFSFIPDNPLAHPDEIARDPFNWMSTAAFWLTPFVATAVACLPDILYKFIKRTYFPENYHIVQELSLIGPTPSSPTTARIKKCSFVSKLPRINMLHGKRRSAVDLDHTGFAFAEDAGAVDRLKVLGLLPPVNATPGLTPQELLPIVKEAATIEKDKQKEKTKETETESDTDTETET